MNNPRPSGTVDDRSNKHGSTSRSLLDGVRHQDSAAWERLVTLYAPLVMYWCRQSNLSESDIADVFQDVFHSVARKVCDFRKDRSGDTFRGWLRTITRNKITDHFRRENRQAHGAGGTEAGRMLSQFPISDTDCDNSDTEDPVFNQTLSRALDGIRGEFQERTWTAFWRVVVGGRTPQDVAEELNMRPGTVRVAKCRVLQRLRQELGELEG